MKVTQKSERTIRHCYEEKRKQKLNSETHISLLHHIHGTRDHSPWYQIHSMFLLAALLATKSIIRYLTHLD